ncbi:fatty acyl-AMP ligase [Actinokineospora xionganensis]|uniref:Fatty acyl-AMP ligase n=1 Tax=Actinokineospora xionganensis TaxID=2684470 RepID=A0ABR7KZV4_9PSEU|nr:fatty acyl-AMP ligase [Actinokineospora xionganensis]MBC6445964.1 fatty acyl-AMP ligase [Actinokineospora xionganensis]
MSVITTSRPHAGLVDAVRSAAAARPEAPAMTFLDYSTSRTGTPSTLTYGELDSRSAAVAARLITMLAPGSRVAVLCPTSDAYVVAFVACVYAGMIAVPLYAPEAYRSNDRALSAMADAGCDAVLTPAAYRPLVLEQTADALPAHRVLAVDEFDAGDRGFEPVPVDPTAIAYLQYTSGSTRRPTGVRVSNHNIAVAAAQMAHAIGVDDTARLVSWLPLFHDMGLVFGLVTPLTQGRPVSLMTPLAFVQQPARWLSQLSSDGATHTMSPNFGLDLCVERVRAAQRAEFNLSALRVLGNGAEPIRARTLARFSEAFRESGFRHEAHMPGYGLAEATLVVTSKERSAPPTVRTFDRDDLRAGRVCVVAEDAPRGRTMVGCGAPVMQEIRVDADHGQVGEILVRGENVCAGYWNTDERAAYVFGSDGWLRTGDIGFVHEGELFVAGRSKDLIIIDGSNYHPVDIELAIEEACPWLRSDHVAVFAFDAGDRERLVVAAEPRQAADRLTADKAEAVRAAVGTTFDLDVHEVVLIRRGTMPRTTSGKIQRSLCRERYERGKLSPARSEPTGD